MKPLKSTSQNPAALRTLAACSFTTTPPWACAGSPRTDVREISTEDKCGHPAKASILDYY